MNNRFVELAYEAKLFNGSQAPFNEVEKFAELIVRECLDIVSKQTTLDTNEDFREGFSHGRKLSWTEIRKHFGVEE